LTEVKQLSQAHLKTSDQTKHLIKALKGDSKIQGTWGELILERVLEQSGLEKGREYEVQKQLKGQRSKAPRPDVLIHLPEKKVVVVDSKVSLTAFEQMQSAQNDEDRKIALSQHVNSVRRHIKNLSSKSYQDVTNVHTLDFVLMFMPIEAALTDALREAPDLFDEALNSNIGLVAPSTMMLTLRTIEHIWRSERQNTNAQEIARRGGALYNKFVGFIEDVEKVGQRILQAQDALGGAKNKLSVGPGNLVRQVEMLRELGAKTSKSMPDSYLPSPEGDEEQDTAANQ